MVPKQTWFMGLRKILWTAREETKPLASQESVSYAPKVFPPEDCEVKIVWGLSSPHAEGRGCTLYSSSSNAHGFVRDDGPGGSFELGGRNTKRNKLLAGHQGLRRGQTIAATAFAARHADVVRLINANFARQKTSCWHSLTAHGGEAHAIFFYMFVVLYAPPPQKK